MIVYQFQDGPMDGEERAFNQRFEVGRTFRIPASPPYIRRISATGEEAPDLDEVVYVVVPWNRGNRGRLKFVNYVANIV